MRAPTERDLQRGGEVALRQRRLQNVAHVRRAVLHSINTKSVRYCFGQVGKEGERRGEGQGDRERERREKVKKYFQEPEWGSPL